MAKARRVTFRRVSVKSIVNQLVGQEPPYPVYRLPRLKFERPERPGQEYRWISS